MASTWLVGISPKKSTTEKGEATVEKDYTQKLKNIIKIDGDKIQAELGELVRESVEEDITNDV